MDRYFSTQLIFKDITINVLSDKVKIHLENGEILLGVIDKEDECTLKIKREGHHEGEVHEYIYLSNIKSIEVVE